MTTETKSPMTGKEKAQWYRELRESYLEDLRLLKDYPKLTRITKQSAIKITEENIKHVDEKLLEDVLKGINLIHDKGFNEDMLSILSLVRDTTNRIIY